MQSTKEGIQQTIQNSTQQTYNQKQSIEQVDIKLEKLQAELTSQARRLEQFEKTIQSNISNLNDTIQSSFEMTQSEIHRCLQKFENMEQQISKCMDFKGETCLISSHNHKFSKLSQPEQN
jgi:ABC-type transporter Mla subunit MlaD